MNTWTTCCTRAEDAIRGLRDAHARLGRIAGTGEGAEGLVRAVADGRGRYGNSFSRRVASDWTPRLSPGKSARRS